MKYYFHREVNRLIVLNLNEDILSIVLMIYNYKELYYVFLLVLERRLH